MTGTSMKSLSCVVAQVAVTSVQSFPLCPDVAWHGRIEGTWGGVLSGLVGRLPCRPSNECRQQMLLCVFGGGGVSHPCMNSGLLSITEDTSLPLEF